MKTKEKENKIIYVRAGEIKGGWRDKGRDGGINGAMKGQTEGLRD